MRSKQPPRTSADKKLRALVRQTIRELTLPREVAEGLDPHEPLPLSLPVRFEAPKGKGLSAEIAALNPRLADVRARLDRLESQPPSKPVRRERKRSKS